VIGPIFHMPMSSPMMTNDVGLLSGGPGSWRDKPMIVPTMRAIAKGSVFPTKHYNAPLVILSLTAGCPWRSAIFAAVMCNLIPTMKSRNQKGRAPVRFFGCISPHTCAPLLSLLNNRKLWDSSPLREELFV